MNWMRVAIVLLALAPALPGPEVSGAESPSASALVQAAIQAHGGRAALERFPDLEQIGTSESFGRGSGRRSDVVYRERADGAYRREMTLEFRGRKMTPVEFYDGEVRKRRFRSSWDDLPVDESAEEARHRLPFLLSLDPATAEALGPATEGDRAVWQVAVPEGDGRAVLSFAQDGGHLVALQYPGTSAAGMGTKEQVERKLIFADYRTVGDLVLPFEIATFEDGSQTGHLRFETIVVLTEFDPVWLRIPDPTRRYIPAEELAF